MRAPRERKSWSGLAFRAPAIRAPAVWALAILPELALGALAFRLIGRHGPALLAMLVCLAICLRFGLTLRPGRTPLITRYARCDRMGLPAECEGYTRRLTAAWAGLLAGFTALHGLAVLDLWSTASVVRWQGFAFTGFFLGEHVLRSLMMPQLGIATPWRTFSAMWQASTRGDQPHAA
jgi:uncharacterized membrane protein